MIIITGASSGIGQACAELFAERKENLFLIARRADRLEALASELSQKHGIRVCFAELDVSSRSAVEEFAEKYANLLASTTVLINNAGLARGLDPIHNGSLDDWDAMIDTNLKGLLYMSRAVVPHLVAAKRGHIINLGSVAGRFAYPKGNVYCATKAAVKSLTETLRLDLSCTGIRVTEIAPGMVETEFTEVRLGDPEKAKAVYAGMTPLSARDIAEAVVWAAERPPHVNIQEMVVYPVDQASPTVVHRRST